MRLLKQSSTAQPLVFLLVQSSDHITGLTGASPSVTLSKNGGSFVSPSGAVSEIGSGWYQVAGNATDTGTLGPLVLHATATSADPCDVIHEVVAFDPQDGVHFGLSALPNAAAAASGGLPTVDGSNQVKANVTAWSGTSVLGSVPPDAYILRSGTAQAGGASTITLDSGASAVNSYYNTCAIFIYSGTGAGQGNTILSYVGSSKVATVARAWATQPDSSSKFVIEAIGSVDVGSLLGNALALDGNNLLKVALTDILNTALSETTAGNLAAAFRKLFDVSSPVLTTASVNQTGDSYAIVNSGTAGNSALHTQIAALPTASAIATAVWTDTTSSDFATSGSPGKILTQTDSNGLLKVDVEDIRGTASPAQPGYLGPDWAHLYSPTSTVGLTNTTISTGQAVASVSGAVGSVTGAVGSVAGNVGGNVTGSVGSISGITFPSGFSSLTTTAIATAIANQATSTAVPGTLGYQISSLLFDGNSYVKANAETVSDKTGYSLTQSFPSNFAALGITAGGKISEVALVDTLTTYTGNTPQTGDAYGVVNNATYGNSALQQILAADRVIDVATDPTQYHEVFYVSGTSSVIFSKKLYDTSGNKLNSTSTVVGQVRQ